ncbi:MAG TPA: STAS domain-containing protein [Noviherbaspirillum sp.]
MTAEQQDAGALLRIQGEMNIYRATELKQELLAPLVAGRTLEIDLSGVTELDTAGLQVLMLAKKTAQALGGELRLVAHSPIVVDVLELLHLSSWFGDPLVIPPSSTPSAR